MKKKTKKSEFVRKLSKFLGLFPYQLRYRLFVFSRPFEGKKGFIIRGALLKTLAKACGDDILIFPHVFLNHIDTIEFGSSISIHSMSYIDGAGGLSIGDNVSIAHGVTIMTTEHRYSDKDLPIREQGFIFNKTDIESNVWIGAKATILAGNVIHTGTVVGANSVVTKTFEKDAVVVGSPAQVIKKR